MKTDKLLNYLFYFSVLVFFIGFNFRDNPQGGWQLQVMPDLNGASIKDITFVDTLVGYAVTGFGGSQSYILKTTNSGYNWSVVLSHNYVFEKVKFINQNTGYANAFQTLFKTTNGGENWIYISLPEIFGDDMFVLNEDTIWLAMSESLTGGVFRTTNGGQNWTQQLAAGNQNPDKIYMYNARIGFITKNSAASYQLRKTTDSGNSWFTVLNEGFTDMYFIDSIKGWKCWGEEDSIKTTTNGGLNWNKLLLPPTGGFYNLSIIRDFSFINKDTIWGVGARAYTSYGFRGLIYISTNGGLNWGYQLPDPIQVNIGRLNHIMFVNKNTGWAYALGGGIHTVTGGDSTIYTSISHSSTEIPKEYVLHQNYPNPFNSMTNVKFQMLSAGQVTINVYDLSGKKIRILVNEYKQAGTYSVSFNAEGLSSGVYFYRMKTNNFTQVKKMILIK